MCTLFVLLSFFVISIETENQNEIMEKDIPLLSRKSGFYNEELKLSISTQKGYLLYARWQSAYRKVVSLLRTNYD